MTCHRAFEIDLAGFLRDPGSAEFADFRSHYPRCADCSAEVRIWTELHLQLQSGGAAAEASHPAEELLLQFEEEPDAMDAAQRATVERHLAQCRSCRDELRALRSFDFGNLERPAPARAQRWWQVIGGVPSWIRGVVMHPAFAYALVLLLLYPTAVKHLVPPESPPSPPAARSAGAPESEAAAPATEQVAKLAEASAEKGANYAAGVTKEANLQRQLPARRGSDAAAARAAPPQAALRQAASEPAAASKGAGDAREMTLGSIGGRARAPREEWPVLTLQPKIESGQGETLASRGVAPESTVRALKAERPPAATVAGESIVGGLVLRVPVQAGTPEGTALEVRVFDSDRHREVRERLTSGRTPYCDVRMPAAWLSVGVYQVELRVADRSAGEFSFQVR
jgi:hypothetical protein